MMTSKGPFKPKAFYDSLIVCCLHPFIFLQKAQFQVTAGKKMPNIGYIFFWRALIFFFLFFGGRRFRDLPRKV